ncbi:MAG: YggS family pyridoxal phosphate-dependent enzyme [Fulvivirga sp.]
MDIKNNIKDFKNYLSDKPCKLVAVSKTKPVSMIQEAYDAGERIFGENRAQEMAEKVDQLPNDIEWHMIGHLQRNKVKYIAPFVHMIHSIDSPRLLKEVNKQAKKNERTIECLLQIHIAKEESKFGLDETELEELLSSDQIKTYENVKVVGLMGMATFTDDHGRVRKEFQYLKGLFEKCKGMALPANVAMSELSMGMSQDYEIAIEEGSTMIRVGSKIFGARN